MKIIAIIAWEICVMSHSLRKLLVTFSAYLIVDCLKFQILKINIWIHNVCKFSSYVIESIENFCFCWCNPYRFCYFYNLHWLDYFLWDQNQKYLKAFWRAYTFCFGDGEQWIIHTLLSAKNMGWRVAGWRSTLIFHTFLFPFVCLLSLFLLITHSAKILSGVHWRRWYRADKNNI